MTRALFRCDRAPVPAELRAQEWDLDESITTWQAGGDLNLRIENLEHALLAVVEDRARDLVRLAAFIYAADQMVSRGGETDVFGAHWVRTMALCVPVTDVAFWSDHRVSERLIETLTFLTWDNWHFSFVPAVGGDGQLVYDVNPRALYGYPDSVALFSGGADSLCAVVEETVEHGRKPLLLSQRAATYVGRRQKDLVELLRARVGDWAFPHTSVWVNRQGSDPKESTQRSRSFLFASLAAAAAVSLGVTDVVLADNGMVSLNLPINRQLVATLPSRSTHPKYVYLMNRLLELLWERPPVIRNPLWNRTRAEGLEILKRHGLAELLQETNSCGATRGLPNATPHCGLCSQCVDRRFASLAAGLEEHDITERYRVDVFREPLREGTSRTIPMGYVDFARLVQSLDTDDALYTEFPQLQEAFSEADPQLSEHTLAVMDMVRRHAAAVLGVMSAQIAAVTDELAAGLLPDCLIRFAAGPLTEQHADKQPCRVVTLTKRQETEFAAHGYKSRLPILITGETEKRATNILLVGNQKVPLDDADFTLFLELVIGLHHLPSKGGWVAFDRLRFWRRDGSNTTGGVEHKIMQHVARLRKPFRHRLDGLRHTEFIQQKASCVRLSTHRAYVDGKWTLLLSHAHAGVVRLSKRLMRLTEPKPTKRGGAPGGGRRGRQGPARGHL